MIDNIPEIKLKTHPETGKIIPEIWKNIKGYEGYYQVSNYGRVVSVAREKGWGKSTKWCENIVLKQKTDKDGYKIVQLSKHSLRKYKKVHRLVAKTFIKNTKNKCCVNHIDEVKSNNYYLNLNWMNIKENNNHGTSSKRAALKNTNGKKSKKVYQYDLEGNFIKEWPSGRELYRNGLNRGNISKCCRGILDHYKNFKWSFNLINNK